jgi:hypothetical protein
VTPSSVAPRRVAHRRDQVKRSQKKDQAHDEASEAQGEKRAELRAQSLEWLGGIGRKPLNQ